MIVPDGTALLVEPGTSLRVEAPVTWTLAAGSLVVNDGEITLGPEAQLDEAPSAAITGFGTERTTRDLSAPVTAEDPGGLGGIITSTIPLGNTLVVRGHVPYTDYSGHTSIGRWIDFTPSNNSGLAASMAFRYDPIELNGMVETDQRLHVRATSDIWWFLPSNVNTSDRTVTTTGLDSLGLFTTFNEDLPNGIGTLASGTHFVLFGAPGEPMFLNIPANERAEHIALYTSSGALSRSFTPRWTSGVQAIPTFDLAAGLYRLCVNHRHNFTILLP
jgi:hypothetical protein